MYETSRHADVLGSGGLVPVSVGLSPWKQGLYRMYTLLGRHNIRYRRCRAKKPANTVEPLAGIKEAKGILQGPSVRGTCELLKLNRYWLR
jgi:hypothetical protein